LSALRHARPRGSKSPAAAAAVSKRGRSAATAPKSSAKGVAGKSAGKAAGKSAGKAAGKSASPARAAPKRSRSEAKPVAPKTTKPVAPKTTAKATKTKAAEDQEAVQFAENIQLILADVHPGVEISSDVCHKLNCSSFDSQAIGIIDGLANNLLKQIATEAARVCHSRAGDVLTTDDIHAAVKAIVPSTLIDPFFFGVLT
jgi:hypothetical protein